MKNRIAKSVFLHRRNMALAGLLAAAALMGQACTDSNTSRPGSEPLDETAPGELVKLPGQPFKQLYRATHLTRAGDTVPMLIQEYDDHFQTEDDILLPKRTNLAKAAANITVNDAKLWPGATVPYVISITDGQRSIILAAMAEWEAKTRLKFVPREDVHGNYVDFVRHSSENSSYVGMVGGRQPINLTFAASISTAMHEIGHAVGLFHEHQRSDRDDHVSGWSNCSGGICMSVCGGPMTAHNCPIGKNNSIFLKDICPIQGTPFGSYDKNSIMHYEKINKCLYYNPVMDAWFDAKPGTASLANAGLSLSAGDIAAVTEMYIKGWRNPDHVRFSADVNGDRRADLVGFGEYGVYVSISNGAGYNAPTLWLDRMGYSHGWDKRTVKVLADVNGDGRSDIVGFGYNDVLVSLSTGSSFLPEQVWHSHFALNDGWDAKTVRTAGDVNADGRADLVCFGHNDVFVALSTGAGFGVAQLWTSSFGYNDGWNELTFKTVADVNGDGRADIVGFGYADVLVGISTGSSFRPEVVWHNNFAYNDGWDWKTTRAVADVNGDGYADIIGFGHNDVLVALSRASRFDVAEVWHTDHGYNDGWDVNTVRLVADYDGDTRADIVGFGYGNVIIRASNSNHFVGGAVGISDRFVYYSNEWGF